MTSCDAALNSNSGCDVTEWSRASYGSLFDQSGGGVIAMEWDESDISICERQIFFPFSLSKVASGSFFRAAVPDDITQGSPNPSLWSAPSAALANTSCDIEQYFVDHSIVFGKCLCVIIFSY